MKIEIIKADYQNKTHGEAIVDLLNRYAQDPMGGEEALSTYTQENLVQSLAKLPHAHSFICFVDDKPAGLINAFEAFSTFKCKPILNIHDVFVDSNYRGMGLSNKLLKAIEQLAQELACCKLTLEVLEGNDIAKASYKNFGFSGYELKEETGKALFWEKFITKNEPTSTNR